MKISDHQIAFIVGMAILALLSPSFVMGLILICVAVGAYLSVLLQEAE